MRGLTLTLAILLSTAPLLAQRGHPKPPPTPPAQMQMQPFRPLSPPPVLPFPPLGPQPAGGLTPGVTFPPRDNRAYNPRFNRGRNGYGDYGGYYGGYGYAPESQPAATAAPPNEPTGLLRLSGSPASAQVFVDGYYVATLADIEAQRALTLPSGPHRIELKASDYSPTTFDVRIDPNETITYRASLDRARPALPPPAAAAGPAKMYLIPNCYLGNVPPKPQRLPSGCDIKRVQVIS